jgi:hypothetical protein
MNEEIVEALVRNYERQIKDNLRPQIKELLLKLQNNQIAIDHRNYVLSININVSYESLLLMQEMLNAENENY